ncbi:MAG: maltotransferase domain-containing protein, partial [Actinomycetota bacterium]
MIGRLIIGDIRPSTPDFEHPAKATVGSQVSVRADVFKDGHEKLAVFVKWCSDAEGDWRSVRMTPVANDRWEGFICPQTLGLHSFEIIAGTDRYATWRNEVLIKYEAGQNIDVELIEGSLMLGEACLWDASATMADAAEPVKTRLESGIRAGIAEFFESHMSFDDETSSTQLKLWVDRPAASYGAWYEFFPRSEGGFGGATLRLDAIAKMGFDIVYLPPIHPIGKVERKGRNNTIIAGPDDPGSPWAIAGHTDIHADLGTFDDFDRFVERANDLGMEIALDYALQCAADHPWLVSHPDWFHHRPDGTIKFAENPPKKYQDIYPINFWPPSNDARIELWAECKQILEFWMSHGVRIFRVDNPHTKPLAFWEWLIAEIHAIDPGVIFLAEAFTRPKMMAQLAQVGFSQSYTYFTWRTKKKHITSYFDEVARGRASDYMRPNFWPNTPDILSGPLRNGGPGAFKQRLVLAATGSSAYGIYSGYELCENEPASDDNEEYLHSEKYEIKHRDWD